MRKKLSDMDIETIRGMRKEGYAVREIAEAMGCSVSTIFRVSTNSNKERCVETVKHYLPEYKREISPKKVKEIYEYRGIYFMISYGEVKEFEIIRVESVANEDIQAQIKRHEDMIGVYQFIKPKLGEE